MAFDGTFRSYFGAILIPILDKGDGTISNVTHDWANAMGAMGAGLGVTVMRLQIKNRKVDVAKERLVEMALANNCQWIYMCDDDTIPPSNTLLKMIKLWRSDPKYKIISGVYWSKSDPPVPLIFKGTLEGSYWDWTINDLFKADGAGAGALFVDTDVFKKMPKPWFCCDYVFEDPRTLYDIQKWNLTDQLGNEMMRGKEANEKRIKGIRKQLVGVANKIKDVKGGYFDPNLMKNKKAAAGTTADLYFFKKAKEHGFDLWIDASIQCMHQDKRTGKMFGITPDMPQARPRYKLKKGEAIVLDLGCGDTIYHIPEGKPIRVDINPLCNPDVLADVRQLPFEDCFADVVFASHVLEHFSYKEIISVLKEWVRVLKRKGKLIIVVPNLKYAAKRILEDTKNQDEAAKTMNILYSGQRGDLKEGAVDIHRTGFTPKSLRGVLNRLGCFENIEINTSDANYGIWKDPRWIKSDESGYNIIATAIKKKHLSPISLNLSIGMQEAAKEHIGEEAKLKKSKKRGRPKGSKKEVKMSKGRGDKPKREKKKPKKKK